LAAAADLFVDLGYEATTMTAIAERSGSSIGGLYNYFPDKQSIAITLRNQYAKELEAHWKPIMDNAGSIGLTTFVDHFVNHLTDFVREHPAFPKLQAAAIAVPRDAAARKASRVLIANAFRAQNSALSPEQALLAASVTLHMVRGMMTLYEEADIMARPAALAEFKKALSLYIANALHGQER